MTLQERTRQILDALATAQEQLNEYAVDLWISADRADERGIQTAADAQMALLKAAREFATVAASIDATIRSHYAAVTELPAAGLDEADVVDTSQTDDEVDPTGQHLSLTMDWTHKRPTAARLGDARSRLDSGQYAGKGSAAVRRTSDSTSTRSPSVATPCCANWDDTQRTDVKSGTSRRRWPAC